MGPSSLSWQLSRLLRGRLGLCASRLLRLLRALRVLRAWCPVPQVFKFTHKIIHGFFETESHNRPRGPHGPAAGRFWEPSAEMRCSVKRALVVSYSHPVPFARYPDPLPTRTVSHVPVGAGL